MELQDRILNTVLDIQSDVKDLSKRTERIESTQTRVFDKIDGFLMLINRHEAEISAVRTTLRRLEDRIASLEAR